MEFREYGNPEEKDYDINSSLNNNYNLQKNIENNHYHIELFHLIGILEDFEEDELIENYGITMKEYLNPNAETIKKVSEKLNSIQNGKSR